MEDLLKVGVITTTHGVRGEVKVFLRQMIRNVSWSLNMCSWIPGRRTEGWISAVL